MIAHVNSPIVTLKNIVKQYSAIKAVDGVDLSIPSGICYGLLGPNGAGKSTISKMIGAIIPCSSGEMEVLGKDPWRDQIVVKANLGVVMQDDTFDEDLDVVANLEIYGLFFGLRGAVFKEKVRGLLRFMELDGKEHMNIQELSGGMRRRLMIARALLNDPKLLILDEPTTGLDPQVRHTIWAALRKLKSQGITILLTTHYMDEAAQLADRVGILNKGRLVAEDTPERLIANNVPRWVLEFDALTAEDALSKLRQQTSAEQHGDRAFVYDDNETRLSTWLKELGVRQAQVRPSSLEDVFLKLTGRSLNE